MHIVPPFLNGQAAEIDATAFGNFKNALIGLAILIRGEPARATDMPNWGLK
jgi:hypothetical protein